MKEGRGLQKYARRKRITDAMTPALKPTPLYASHVVSRLFQDKDNNPTYDFTMRSATIHTRQ